MLGPKNATRRRGCLIAAVLGVLAVLLPVAGWVFLSLSLPEDAPLARMYRTEAELRVLVNAVETYREAKGAYPIAGPQGLDAAVRYLSRNVDYLPGGAPVDAWGRPFRYVPHNQYADPQSVALKDSSGAFHAPDTFQIYSPGADGDTGLANSAATRDNIASWDDGRSWRELYQTLNAQYMEEPNR